MWECDPVGSETRKKQPPHACGHWGWHWCGWLVLHPEGPFEELYEMAEELFVSSGETKGESIYHWLWSSLGQGRPHRLQLFWAFGWCLPESWTVLKDKLRHLKNFRKNWLESYSARASLVVQWLRIRLPMQGTRVRALVREDATCRGATKPVRHNYWACALEPMSHNYWAHMPQLLKPVCLEPMLRNKRSHCNEKPAQQRRVAPARHN